MLLAIDVGNTNTVFAMCRDGAIKGQWRLGTTSSRTADEYGILLQQLLATRRLGFRDVDDVVISTVVPQTLFALTQLCRGYLQCEPMVVTNNLDLGMTINVDRPSEVGADRLVNAVAARRTYGFPLIVVDFGTATTFDVIGTSGDYEGGVIAPGINLSLEALHRAAAKLPLIAVERPSEVIGKGTVGAMQSGVFWGYVGLIEGIVSRVQREIGDTAKVVATGGLAPLFSGATNAIHHVDPDLTIRGMLEIHERNRSRA